MCKYCDGWENRLPEAARSRDPLVCSRGNFSDKLEVDSVQDVPEGYLYLGLTFHENGSKFVAVKRIHEPVLANVYVTISSIKYCPFCGKKLI